MASIGGSNIVRSGLVLNLDAASPRSYTSGSTTWVDVSGFGNNGTLTNGPTFSSANGGTIVFDGVNDYIDCGNASILNITGSITVESWIYLTSLSISNDPNLISKYSNTGGIQNQAWIIFKSTDNYQSFGPGNTGPLNNEFGWLATSAGSVNGALIGTGEQVSANTWYQVVGVFDSPNNSMQIYVNGALKRNVTRTGQTAGLLATGSRNVQIGGTPADNIRWVQGRIPASRIYNRALTSSEILQNYNATKTRFGL